MSKKEEVTEVENDKLLNKLEEIFDDVGTNLMDDLKRMFKFTDSKTILIKNTRQRIEEGRYEEA